mmetsp:Transcript_9296/g.30745  ORF Transcript_9296/g.30745 Transcript_9296/m.30745 type:complete len:201 (-) Transcript_9296:308-910(-)
MAMSSARIKAGNFSSKNESSTANDRGPEKRSAERSSEAPWRKAKANAINGGTSSATLPSAAWTSKAQPWARSVREVISRARCVSEEKAFGLSCALSSANSCRSVAAFFSPTFSPSFEESAAASFGAASATAASRFGETATASGAFGRGRRRTKIFSSFASSSNKSSSADRGNTKVQTSMPCISCSSVKASGDCTLSTSDG